MGASRFAIFRHVKLPATYTPLFSALKLSATFSVTGAVIGEWTASTSGGLGAYLLQANSRLNTAGTFAAIALPRPARRHRLRARRACRACGNAVAVVFEGAALVARLLARAGTTGRSRRRRRAATLMSEAPPRSRAARPTIRDVARASGVSIGTVSAVINGSASVSPQTRRQVLATVAELGYEPNSAARSLKRRRISSIGLIVPDLGNPFFAMVAEGVQRAAEANDVLLVLCITWAKSEREEYYAQVLKTQRLDGVLYLSGTGIPSPSLLELAREDQVVFVDECLPGIDVPLSAAQSVRRPRYCPPRARGGHDASPSSAARRGCGRRSSALPAIARRLPPPGSTRTRSRCSTATISSHPATPRCGRCSPAVAPARPRCFVPMT